MGNILQKNLVWRCCIAAPEERRRLVIANIDSITQKEIITIMRDSHKPVEIFCYAKMYSRRHFIDPEECLNMASTFGDEDLVIRFVLAVITAKVEIYEPWYGEKEGKKTYRSPKGYSKGYAYITNSCKLIQSDEKKVELFLSAYNSGEKYSNQENMHFVMECLKTESGRSMLFERSGFVGVKRFTQENLKFCKKILDYNMMKNLINIGVEEFDCSVINLTLEECVELAPYIPYIFLIKAKKKGAVEEYFFTTGDVIRMVKSGMKAYKDKEVVEYFLKQAADDSERYNFYLEYKERDILSEVLFYPDYFQEDEYIFKLFQENSKITLEKFGRILEKVKDQEKYIQLYEEKCVKQFPHKRKEIILGVLKKIENPRLSHILLQKVNLGIGAVSID